MRLPAPVRNALAGAVAFLAAALLLAACSKKPTSVDASYTTPEGQPSGNSRLVLWAAESTYADVFKDSPPIGPGREDEYLETRGYSHYPAGALLGMLFDHSPASAFQILRREYNGGLRELFDFPVQVTRRWLDKQTKLYEFSDLEPTETPDYIGRGLVAGGITVNSPLSNEAKLVARPLQDIPLHFPTDTTVTWDAVPDAAYYIAHIYQMVRASPEEAIRAGGVAPIYRGQSKDFFLGVTTTPQEIGRNLPFTGTILTQRNLVPGQYLYRVSAIDANGQFVGFSYGDSAFVSGQSVYQKFSLGAAVIPRRRAGSQPGLARATSERAMIRWGQERF